MSETAPPPTRTFTQFVGEVEDGRLHGDLSEALRDLIGKLHEASGRGGKAAGSLAVTFAFKFDDGIVEVVADYKAKAPQMARGRSIFWATPDNNLTRRNPSQPDLPFRDVNAPPTRALA